ncbi:glutamate synthase subunit beta [Aureicoccus marinus]|jgi:glutamate synthase (NADPH/NADH) small chain|uniref:Glutamate synthase n=1 Tax=Aureicoccus marinus TaxID=754435 RepID=A0A2S7T475_9FLAO|nr:glutamate synthase subunit beta [Aureicoccus marinus]PQJ14347.1 glutamate synthase [Aureicoccus marinus]
MGKTTGFLEYKRKTESSLPVEERTTHYKEFTKKLRPKEVQNQGARCMDCGIPFCHSGCPLGNLIPDFNDAVYQENWEVAAQILHSTNNFPEFTGRLCPAPCEEACVLGINEDPVAIETIEKNIVERAFAKGLIVPKPPQHRSGKRIAIVGSGPAGLAAAQQLNRAGHEVVVFERNEKPGGLLRYGIPDFKLEKKIIDRRLEVLEKEGIEFRTGVHVGFDISAKELYNEYDAVLLSGGASVARSLSIEGMHLDGVHQAMDFLSQSNQRVSGELNSKKNEERKADILATDKRVVVIGGGDTGSDCIGTSIRQGAEEVTNFEIMPMAGLDRPQNQPWPFWPMRLRTSSSHEEGAERVFSISTKKFIGDKNGRLRALQTVEVKWEKSPKGRLQCIEVPGTEKEWPCELALLALGFTGSEKTIAEELGVDLTQRGNLKASEEDYATDVPGVFAAGDQRRGQSLIVWAISEGREAAYHIDTYLMASSSLARKGEGDLPRV